MKQDCMIQEILELLHNELDIEPDICDMKHITLPLTGNVWRLNAAKMVWLYFELEKKYNVIIPYNLLEDYQFSTVQNIASIIQSVKINEEG